MKFVSYAQNDEDILLWRALKSVQRGFYIDVGAAIIDGHSVSRAFYEHGWRGVNVEPVPELCAAVLAARPEDVTLGIALGRTDGERDFFTIPQTGLSTLDPVIAEAHRAAGWTVAPGRISVRTLGGICREYATGPIHFLKIDVEGAEAEVLAGADFSAFRPWILVIEATWPGRPEASHAAWEPALLAQGYRFAWFDGLNRFYVAAEQEAHLAPHFRTPPNVWDEFERFDAAHAQELAAARADCLRIEGVLAGKEKEFAAGMAAASAEAFALRRAYFCELEAKTQRERQLSESEAKNRSLAEELGHVQEEAERLERLFAERQPSEGPPGLHAVDSETASTTGIRPRALVKALLRPFWRAVKPLIRPLAWRARGFLIGPTQERLAELSNVQARLAELSNVPARLAELSDLQQRLGESTRLLAEQAPAGTEMAALETALLTIALSGETHAPDQPS